jgi:asparagine synthase (glutamine-hydrolysing)
LTKKLANEIWITSLPALLKHADRNSMIASIESRVPFLTPALASDALALANQPQSLVFGKKVQLVQSTGRYLPEEILSRRDKVGFSGEALGFEVISQPEILSSIQALSLLPWLKVETLQPFKQREGAVSGRDFRILSLALWIRRFIAGDVEASEN